MVRLLSFFDNVINKILVLYRKRLFREKTGNDVSSLKILGKVLIGNRNIKIGKNVVFFDGVTFFGDGPIVIGDNVCLGYNTIIFASKNGGITIESNTQIGIYVI